MSDGDSCSCGPCTELCKSSPGWPTPDEALAAIHSGKSSRLMLDWWEPNGHLRSSVDGGRIYILSPAARGHEGHLAPAGLGTTASPFRKGRCTFLTERGLCEVHGSGFKPLQCRQHFGCRVSNDYFSSLHVAMMWNTPSGRSVVELWRSEVSAKVGEQVG